MLYLLSFLLVYLMTCYIIMSLSAIGKEIRIGNILIESIFAWYDVWIGGFWDKKGILYIFLLPMYGFKITFFGKYKSVYDR